MNSQFANETRWDLKRVALLVSGIILLSGTWYALFRFIAGVTEGWLAPWDTWPHPPLGTWERTVNDFFETYPGAFLPSSAVILASAALFVLRMTRSEDKVLLPWLFAVTNLLFIVVDAVLAIFAHQLPNLWLPQPRPEIDIGYHYTWPAFVVTVFLLILLFIAQARLKLAQKSSSV
jgi:hypothetical protein